MSLNEAMNEVIYETVVTTLGSQGQVQVAPMGVRYEPQGEVVLKPFRPSTTLDNILAQGAAVVNVVTDTRVFAGCVTGRRQWPTVPVERAGLQGQRLTLALRHLLLQLVAVEDDGQRPTLRLRVVEEVSHGVFLGFNRAQAAVIEGAVLVSRLHLLPLARIEHEMSALQVAIDKTASAVEREAWGWLCEAVAAKARSAQGVSS